MYTYNTYTVTNLPKFHVSARIFSADLGERTGGSEEWLAIRTNIERFVVFVFGKGAQASSISEVIDGFSVQGSNGCFICLGRRFLPLR